MENKINQSFPNNIADHPNQKMAREVTAKSEHRHRNLQLTSEQFISTRMARILNNDQHLIKRLVPDFPVGCRRLGPAEGFLESFLEHNVELAEGDIESFTETGLRTVQGRSYDADVIICATGFEVSFKPQFPVIGREGHSLAQVWESDPSAYLAMAASGFPNFMRTSNLCRQILSCD